MIVYNLAEILAEIIRYHDVPQSKTEEFRIVKHNQNLCQRAERQLDYMLQNFVKYYSIAYDVQGPRDQGADIVLQVRPQIKEKESDYSIIVLQIKSYDDFQNKDYLIILRAQYQQALAHYGRNLEHYYILLCTDQIEHVQKIRNSKQAFSTFPNVTVISPSYSLGFLRLSSTRIGLIIQCLMREEDAVLMAARKLCMEFNPPQNAIVLFLIYRSTFYPNEPINLHTLESSAFVTNVYKACPDYDAYDILEERVFYERNQQEFAQQKWEWSENPFKYNLKDRRRDLTTRLVDDLDILDDGILDMDRSADTFVINMSEYRAIQSFILDSHVRYGYSESELLHFVFGALGVAERYGLDLVSDDPL